MSSSPFRPRFVLPAGLSVTRSELGFKAQDRYMPRSVERPSTLIHFDYLSAAPMDLLRSPWVMAVAKEAKIALTPSRATRWSAINHNAGFSNVYLRSYIRRRSLVVRRPNREAVFVYWACSPSRARGVTRIARCDRMQQSQVARWFLAGWFLDFAPLRGSHREPASWRHISLMTTAVTVGLGVTRCPYIQLQTQTSVARKVTATVCRLTSCRMAVNILASARTRHWHQHRH